MIAEQVQMARPVGIMLHHADIDVEDRAALTELLELLSSRDGVHCLPIRSIAKRINAGNHGE